MHAMNPLTGRKTCLFGGFRDSLDTSRSLRLRIPKWRIEISRLKGRCTPHSSLKQEIPLIVETAVSPDGERVGLQPLSPATSVWELPTRVLMAFAAAAVLAVSSPFQLAADSVAVSTTPPVGILAFKMFCS